MAMIKWSRFSGERDGELLIQTLIPGEQIKTASPILPEVQRFVGGLKPCDKYTYVLVNAMGYSEFYGANSNKDYYGYNPHLDFNGLLHDWDGIGETPGLDRMRGKAWPHGYPCFYNAAVYAHHRNTDPTQLGFGDVALAVPNPRMKRIELVLRIHNEEAEKKGHQNILSRIRNGERADVSMGCFRAGALITMSDGTRKPIEDIQIGDNVLTHKGRARRVTKTHRRSYTGTFFAIRPEGEPEMHATVEHPFWAVDVSAVRDSSGVWRSDVDLLPGWVHARCLEDKMLTAPVHQGLPGQSAEVSESEARIIGYYLADGHITRDKKRQPNGIHLSVCPDNPVLSEIQYLCEEIGSKNGPVFSPHPRTDKCQYINVYDRRIADMCVRYAGELASTKKLNPEIFSWDRHTVFTLIGAYANGDGHGTDKGELKLSTSSRDLGYQIRDLLRKFDIPSSINCLQHKAGSGFSQEDTFEWVIHIGRQWAHQLASYCYKVRPHPVIKAKNPTRRYGDTWCVPTRTLEEYEGSDFVYNFEVEDDESYVVNGVSAHNCKVPLDLCSVCSDWKRVRQAMATFDPKVHAHSGIPVLREHQKSPIQGAARTRIEYCEHMKTMGGQVLPDGRKVFVYNDFCRFFDISFVWVGADKTARVMWHLRGENPLQDVMPKPTNSPETLLGAILSKVSHVDLRKIGEMEKDIPGGLAQSVLSATDRDSTIAPAALDALKKQCGGTKPLLSTLSAAGIVLKPEEFQRVTELQDPGENVVLRALSSMGRVFDTDHSGIDDSLAVSPSDVVPDVLSRLGQMLHARSSYTPFLAPRVRSITIVTRVSPKKYLPVDTGEVSTKVAALYNGYRLSMLENAPKLAEMSVPWISGSLDEDTKYASLGGKGILALLLGTGSLVSLMSSHLRRKERAGVDLGTVSKFVADHPTMTAAVTAGAGLRAAMGIQAAGGVAGAAEALVQAAKTVGSRL